ncbi:hypothetical protein HMPREF1093_03526 [Hungatella hathewayi 12489931]|jgi:hypothetical protein|uniref:hypothetical protein n=1 Tax=Hungatella hathewayi TaxID=154046 RepID=UPI0002D1C968|nr:hypothetical protein [Hungatella hathewayi]ENY93450.1 hypothetical protein HMPREF1093_03526 [Hungatella hathewayi 12489931]
MIKKLLLSAFFVTWLLSACSGKTTPPPAETTVVESTSESPSIDSTSETQETRSDLEAMGDFNTEKGLFNVELNIPKEFAGEKTQDELDATAKELGYQSITLNEDGSVTYVMTKKQHKQMMVEVKESLNSTLQKMVGSEDYPNFTNISTNADFTKFEITTTSTELSLAESFSVLGFYMYGGMYNTFNGTPVDNVSVSYINADSGEIIEQLNSKDMGSKEQ